MHLLNKKWRMVTPAASYYFYMHLLETRLVVFTVSITHAITPQEARTMVHGPASLF